MLFDFFIKFWATPENIIGLIGNVVMVIAMCFIFRAWKEKWWKCFIPLYGTYIIYKWTWKKQKWLFVVQLFFDVINIRCTSFVKKYITTNIVHTIKTYIETEQINIEMSVGQLLVCLVLMLLSMLITFVLTRITYLKICNSLGIDNILLKIGTFLFPQVFLLVDYIYYAKSEPQVMKDEVA